MRSLSLAGAWEFQASGESTWRRGTVPGCVHTDLLALAEIPDPFFRDNERHVQWVAEREWIYRKRFELPDALRRETKRFLVADGIDTLATVTLNGRTLGDVDNQFRSWEWEVDDAIADGWNELEIVFRSPVNEAAARQVARPMTTVAQQLPGAPHLRKAPYHFGWDWGPKLPTVGIWKDLRIEARSGARLRDVDLRQHHAPDSVSVRVDAAIERWDEGDLVLSLRIVAPEGEAIGEVSHPIHGDAAHLELPIEDPKLWWPNGFGPQPLYAVEVELIHRDDAVCDTRVFTLGLRTIELRREPDAWGESFEFVVNGLRIFAKGSNWIPPDAFEPRITNDRLESLIRAAAATHQNMLRIWGGGGYGSEQLYNLCDRYGLLVWQDFAFSCSVYPFDDPIFVGNVRAEVEENVRRIRHRASLALLCGNNEMDQGWESWGWGKHDAEDELLDLAARIPALGSWVDPPDETTRLPDWRLLRDRYERFFYDRLPAWLLDLAPDVAYWPASPSSGTPYTDANGGTSGDAHFWEVWHGRKPFEAFRTVTPRFMSEFGFQAFPTMATIETYTDPEDRNLVSRIMESHQRGHHGNGLILSQMADHFRTPTSFAGWIYLSLILQAEGIRIGVEHWRRHRDRVGGTLYWQLDDCWPVASWSSIDYHGRWKALHYAARRFYAPILLSVLDEGPRMELHLTNDLPHAWTGTVRWSLEHLDGDAISSGDLDIGASALSDTTVAALDFADRLQPDDRPNHVLVCELLKDGRRIVLSVHPFVPSKHLGLRRPSIDVRTSLDVDRLTIALRSDTLARFVELRLDGAPDVVFSDNDFDLPAGRTCLVTCPIPSDWTQQRTRAALHVTSLVDTYAPTGPYRAGV